MLTNKGKYGLKAMLHLAGLPEKEIASAAQIAEMHGIPKKFLDQIFAELRCSGLIYSKKGKSGGFALAKPAHTIKAGDVIRVLDGPISPFPCASMHFYRRCDDCDGEENCAVRRLMVDAREALCKVLDNQSLAQMLEQQDLKKAA
jgi:Rrf2 family protein